MSAEITVTTTNVGVTLSTGTVTSITAGAGLTGGVITTSGTIAVDFAPNGAGSATQVPSATDSRLSNARTPTSHAASHNVLTGADPVQIEISQVTGLTAALAQTISNSATITAGTGLTGGGLVSGNPTISANIAPSGGGTATQLVGATDSRLSNNRTPTNHASTHGPLGTDPIPAGGLAQTQVANLVADLAAKINATRQVIAGTGLLGGGDLSADRTLAVNFAPSGGGGAGQAVEATDSRLTNGRGPTGSAGGDLAGTYPNPTVGKIATYQVDTSAPVTGDVWSYSGTQWNHVAPTTLATSASLSNYLASGLGAVTRTVSSRLNDVVNVKDFGAVGDGVTNDTAAINAALLAAMGKTVWFPAGTYLMTQTGTNQISLTLSDHLTLRGDNAILKAAPITQVNQMIYVTQANQFNVSMSGLIFDGNQKAQSLVRIDNTVGTAGAAIALVTVDNCEFRNGLAVVGGVGGSTGTIGLLVSGGYRHVAITNTKVINMNRQIGSNISGSSGTVGIAIGPQSGLYCESANVAGCLIADILNSETTASTSNQDTDGLSIFGGLNTGGSTYVPCAYTVTNNTFVNCKGRSIKIQTDEANISNNVFRFAIRPCASANTGLASFGGIVNFQGVAGTITDNVWHYDPAPGNSNPFSITNTPGDAGSSCIVFFPTGTDQRPRSITIRGNVVYNNVPEAVGSLLFPLQSTEASMPSGAAAQPMFVTINENRVLGGACKYFLNTALRTSAAGTMYLTIADNAISKIQSAFMVNASSGSYDNNVIRCTGNINATAPAVLHLENFSSPGSSYPAQITARNNVNIGLAVDQERVTTTSFLSRATGVAPLESVGGMLSIQVVTIADGAVFSFPRRSQNTYGGMRLITSTYGGETNVLFSQSGSTLVSHANPSSVSVIAATGNAGSGAGKLNIGQDVNLIQVRNNTGSSRTVTLYTFG